MTADQRIAEIEAREAKATKGPWYLFGGGGYVSVGAINPSDVLKEMPGASYGTGWNQNSDNLSFCAHARSDIPWLLAELKKLRAEMPCPADGQAKETR